MSAEKLEEIRARHGRGEWLYSRDEVGVLLEEIDRLRAELAGPRRMPREVIPGIPTEKSLATEPIPGIPALRDTLRRDLRVAKGDGP